MGRKRPQKGGRRSPSGKGSSPGDQRRGEAAQKRGGTETALPGPARLLLTRVVREGRIWEVYVATIARNGAPNITQLEFESRSERNERVRHTRPVAGSLLEALHSGAPVSRGSLAEELDAAVRNAGVTQDESDAAPVPTEATGSAGDASPDAP